MSQHLSSISGGEFRNVSGVESGYKQPVKKESVEEKAIDNTPKDGVTLSIKKETEPPKKVKTNTFPQDALMDEPSTQKIDQSKIGTRLEGPRAKSFDNKPVAIADPDGNFFYNPVDREFNQVNSYVVTYKTLDMHENYAGHKVDWAFGSEQLGIYPHKAEGANAYYSRWARSTNFFYFKSEGLDKTVQTSQSADVVAHETGHAILDGLKPRFLSGSGGETMAFHEAYADTTAMLYTLNHEDNLDKIIEETGGDLRQTNRLSMLAEEFGKAIQLMNDDPSDDHMTYLRNARNEFKYVPMNQLPSSGPREELTNQVHSFSRIFSGAFYDCLNKIYDKYVDELPQIPVPAAEEGLEQPDRIGALRMARDVTGHLFAKAVELSPSTSATFKGIALNMLKADQMINDGKYSDLLADVFVNRNIIKPEDISANSSLTAQGEPIVLDRPLESSREALNYLESIEDKIGVKASDFSDAKIIKNNRGETTIEFESVKEVCLSSQGIYKVAGVKDLYMDVFGGMTLGFDSSGKLVSIQTDEITPEKVQEASSFVKETEKEGLVRRSPFYKASNLFKSKNVPYKAEVYQDPSGKMKVQRIPIIVG